MRAAGCFLEYDGKFVILHRHSHKPDGDTWGLPGGKVESGESDQEAVARELAEETGYRAALSELEHLGDYEFVTTRGEQAIYATYRIKLTDPHEVTLEEAAHSDFMWVTAADCDKRTDLMYGLHDLLRFVGYIPADGKVEARPSL